MGCGGGSFWNPVASILQVVAPALMGGAMGLGAAGAIPGLAGAGEGALGTGMGAAEGAMAFGDIGAAEAAASAGQLAAGAAGGGLGAGLGSLAESVAGSGALGPGMGAAEGAMGAGDIGAAIEAATAGAAPGAFPAAAFPAAPIPAAAAVTPGVSAPGTAGPAGAMGPVGASGTGLDVGPGVAPGAVGPGPGASATGGSSLAQLAKDLLPYMKIGATGLGGAATVMNALQGADANKLARQATEQRMTAMQPAITYGTQQLQTAQANQVTPAQQAQLDTSRTQMKARINQYLANAGLLDSTTAQEWYSWIDRQVLAMQADMIQQNAASGISAISAGSAAGPAGIQPQTYQTALQGAQQTLGQLAAIGG